MVIAVCAAVVLAVLLWERFQRIRLLTRLDDMLDAVGIDPCKLCTYCWNGKE